MSELGEYAFSNCKNLEELYLPYTLATIGDNAFEDCPALKTLHIRKDGETITVPLERELDDAYWQEIKAGLVFGGKQEELAPQAAQIIPQTSPIAELMERVSALEALVTAQQAQITQLTERLKELTPPRRITSFHPLSEGELRRL